MDSVTGAELAPAAWETTVVEVVLAHEGCAHCSIALPHTCTKDRKVVVAARSKQRVLVNRLMGAVKTADAKVHDAGL